jgi:hypothetical protein
MDSILDRATTERGATMARIGIVTLVLAVSWSTVQATAEATESAAVCHIEVHATANPGLWANRPAEGSTSQSKPGTVTCTGVISGRRLSTEAGSFSMSFNFGSNGPGPGPIKDTDCFHGWTTGQWRASVPTVGGGTVDLLGPLAGGWTGLAWRADGRLGEHSVMAVGQTRGDPDYPDENCVTTAFEHFIDTGQLVIR